MYLDYLLCLSKNLIFNNSIVKTKKYLFCPIVTFYWWIWTHYAVHKIKWLILWLDLLHKDHSYSINLCKQIWQKPDSLYTMARHTFHCHMIRSLPINWQFTCITAKYSSIYFFSDLVEAWLDVHRWNLQMVEHRIVQVTIRMEITTWLTSDWPLIYLW